MKRSNRLSTQSDRGIPGPIAGPLGRRLLRTHITAYKEHVILIQASLSRWAFTAAAASCRLMYSRQFKTIRKRRYKHNNNEDCFGTAGLILLVTPFQYTMPLD